MQDTMPKLESYAPKLKLQWINGLHLVELLVLGVP